MSALGKASPSLSADVLCEWSPTAGNGETFLREEGMGIPKWRAKTFNAAGLSSDMPEGEREADGRAIRPPNAKDILSGKFTGRFHIF